MLEKHPKEAVVSCGGGIVETEPARALLLAHHGPVIFVDKNIQDIAEYLALMEAKQHKQQETTTSGDQEPKVSASESLDRRPNYGESVESVWARRYPFFVECSTHCFCIPKSDNDWERLSREFETLAMSLFTRPTPPVLSANCWLGRLDAESAGERVDSPLDAYVLTGCSTGERLARCRRATCLPLMLDCGSDPSLVAFGLKHCVPLLLVGGLETVALAKKETGRWQGTSQVAVVVESAAAAEALLEQQHTVGSAPPPLAGIVLRSAEFQDGEQATAWLSRFKSAGLAVGFYSSVRWTGPWGLQAQGLCLARFGPVLLDAGDSGPGADLVGACQQAPLAHHCLFGHPIQLSPSPAMHNAGFSALGLAREYTLCDTLDPQRLGSVIRSHRFRGASVTIPHKEVVGQFLDSLSDAATQIGAVNTVVKDAATGKLLGDNTDWWGLYNTIKGPLERRSSTSGGNGVALVVGAGGTAMAACYCVSKLGMELLVYNRTLAKASKLAERFGGKALSELNDVTNVDLIIGTIPAASNFEMPLETLLTECKPIVFDVAYRPRRTALLKQAARCGCETFEGIDMLVEQGLKQMELWAEQDAPRQAMDAAARAFYDATDPAKKAS